MDGQITADKENPVGGSGGVYVLPGAGLKDARAERRAIMERWNVPADELGNMVKRQIDIATNIEASPRESTQAFLAVVKARQQDLDIEKLEGGQKVDVNLTGKIDHDHTHHADTNNLAAVLQILGEVGAFDAGEADAGTNPETDEVHPS